MNSEPIYQIGVISDTHGSLHPRVAEIFARVNLILHAGDVGNDDILEELETIAPLIAVAGNVDGSPRSQHLPLVQQMTTFLGKIALTHGHLPGASAYRPGTLIEYFQDFKPRIVVFGHTHLPTLTVMDEVTLFNPGAAGRIRVGGRAPSVGLITLDEGQFVPRLEHVTLE